jgi:hypothetical protein
MIELSYPQKSNGIYVLSKRDIETLAENTLQLYQPQALRISQPVDLNALAEERLQLHIQERRLSPDGHILGAMIFAGLILQIGNGIEHFSKGTILLDTSLNESDQAKRKRFTLAHEIGHWLLHRPLHAAYGSSLDSRISCRHIACRTYGVGGSCSKLLTDYDWEEWQAIPADQRPPLATRAKC